MGVGVGIGVAVGAGVGVGGAVGVGNGVGVGVAPIVGASVGTAVEQPTTRVRPSIAANPYLSNGAWMGASVSPLVWVLRGRRPPSNSALILPSDRTGAFPPDISRRRTAAQGQRALASEPVEALLVPPPGQDLCIIPAPSFPHYPMRPHPNLPPAGEEVNASNRIKQEQPGNPRHRRWPPPGLRIRLLSHRRFNAPEARRPWQGRQTAVASPPRLALVHLETLQGRAAACVRPN